MALKNYYHDSFSHQKLDNINNTLLSGNVVVGLSTSNIIVYDSNHLETHSKLDTLNTSLTGNIEVFDTTTHNKLDTINTTLGNLSVTTDNTDVVNALSNVEVHDLTTHNKLDTLNTSLSNVEVHDLTTHNKLDTLNTSLSNVEVHDLTTHNKLDTLNTTLSGTLTVNTVDLTTLETNTSDNATQTTLSSLDTKMGNFLTAYAQFNLNGKMEDGKSYIVSEFGTTNGDFLTLFNPSNSGVNAYVNEVTLSCNNSVDMVLRKITAHTAGTTATPLNINFGSVNTSACESYKEPSAATDTGNLYNVRVKNIVHENFYENMVKLTPGTGLLVDVLNNGTGYGVGATIRWYEE